ncbi:hypothetical protein [Candidatus Chloroploca sp. Khr17]|uniref:WD40/YVTN/BNR-like repeat-containing protein n=1 Tax=Candidatus Chloroploca sp. Khr17 TaxID=2496869 RepID=UPI00101DF728|nr:hypothetical protein [Candidatus Chloroploca sp. Khr17]
MIWKNHRITLTSLGLSAIIMLLVALMNLVEVMQPVGASEGEPSPHLKVESIPAADNPLAAGDQLMLVMTISNTLDHELEIFRLDQVLSPTLPLEGTIYFSDAISGCTTLPCETATVVSNTTALITTTYTVKADAIVGNVISHTTTLSAPILAAPLVWLGVTSQVDGPQLHVNTHYDSEDPTIDGHLSLTIVITNPSQRAIESMTVSQTLVPELPLVNVELGDQIANCEAWPCDTLTILSNTTGLITATYYIDQVVDQPITHTSTLSSSILPKPQVFIDATRPVKRQRLFLPIIQDTYPDIYAQWVQLAQPAGGTSINYIYVSQATMACSGPTKEQYLPTTILAATNNGIYQLRHASVPGELPTWELRGSNTISVSHIISTTNGYFASSFNQNSIFRSTDGGQTWQTETLPEDNRFVYWLAASGERILAAGNRGLFIRETDGGWVQDTQVTGSIFGVAARGTNAYAIQIGNDKDTLWGSTEGGAPGTWASIGALPGTANFMQTLYADNESSDALLIGVIGGGIYRLHADGTFTPFSQDANLTVYGMWRDAQQRLYAAFREPGGLQRFAPEGGAGEPLHTLGGDAPSNNERIYSINGNAGDQCGMIITGSRQGTIHLRRIP